MKYSFRIIFILTILAGISGCNNSKILEKITVSEVNLNSVTNGTYRGSYRLNLPLGYFIGQSYAIVDVSISNNRFTSINLINIPGWLATNKQTKIPQLLDLIMQEQKLNVDAIDGASFTKKAIQKAVENAFSNQLLN